MRSTAITADKVFAPLIGQIAWQVRSNKHGCVMMEFGAPHLDIREPRQAPVGSSQKVTRLLARRAVSVMGDWHLWIEICNWTLTTGSGKTSSEEETADFWQQWMDDITGQHLVSAQSPAPGALTLSFDGGVTLEVKPDSDGELDSWSLHAWENEIISCSASGKIEIERWTQQPAG